MRVGSEAVAERRRLGRLQMRKGHANEVGTGANRLTEGGEQRIQVFADIREREAQPIRLDGVLDIHRGCAEVQLPAAARGLPGEHANLGHEVVMYRALDLERRVDVDIGGVRAQIVEFGLFDETLSGLRLRERDPDGSPQPSPRLLRVERAQLRTAISPGKRRGVRAVVHELV